MVIGYINYVGISTVLVEILRVRKSELPQRSSVISYLLGPFGSSFWVFRANNGRETFAGCWLHAFVYHS